MTGLEIILCALLLVSTFTAWALASRCIHMYDSIQALKQKNDDLVLNVKHLKAENERLRSRVYINPNVDQITALKLELHFKQEKIDALRAKLEKQNMLLRQKWEGSKKCS